MTNYFDEKLTEDEKQLFIKLYSELISNNFLAEHRKYLLYEDVDHFKEFMKQNYHQYSFLGEGISRLTYQFNSQLVIKISKGIFGYLQNLSEIEVFNKKLSCFTYLYGNINNSLLLIEKAVIVKDNYDQFQQIFDVDEPDLEILLEIIISTCGLKLKTNTLHSIDELKSYQFPLNEKCQIILDHIIQQKNQVWKSLYELISYGINSKRGLLLSEYIKYENRGFVTRNNVKIPVVLDCGIDNIVKYRQISKNEIKKYLDNIDKINSNQHYNRSNFDKFIDNKFDIEFHSLEKDGNPVAVASMMKTPANLTGDDESWLITYIASFKKEYGEILLGTLSYYYNNIWLSVDWTGGEKLEQYYDNVLGPMKWKKFRHQSPWKKDRQLQTFWHRAKSSIAEEAIVFYVVGAREKNDQS